jgi:hypothetical protein
MTKLNIIVPALVFVILVMAFGWIYSCESKKDIVQQADVTQWRTVIDGLKSDTTIIRTRNRELTRRIMSDSTTHANVISVKNITIVRLKSSSAVQMPDIQPILDSIPKLQAFVNVHDSIIIEQASVIDELNASYKAQVKGLNEQIEIHGQVQAKNDEIMRLYEERIGKLTKDFKKSERRRKFNRTMMYVFGAGLGTAIILSQ